MRTWAATGVWQQTCPAEIPVAKDGGDLHLRGFFLGDGYPSKEADTYQQPLGAIKLLRGWGFSFFVMGENCLCVRSANLSSGNSSGKRWG